MFTQFTVFAGNGPHGKARNMDFGAPARPLLVRYLYAGCRCLELNGWMVRGLHLVAVHSRARSLGGQTEAVLGLAVVLTVGPWLLVGSARRGYVHQVVYLIRLPCLHMQADCCKDKGWEVE
jgi:hypothetical protein